MKINTKSTSEEKINSAIVAVAGKISRVPDYSDVISAIKSAEKHLNRLLPKKNWGGIQLVAVKYDSKKARSYKFKRIYVAVVLQRFASGWFIVDVRRSEAWPNETIHNSLILSDKQNTIIAGNAASAVGELNLYN